MPELLPKCPRMPELFGHCCKPHGTKAAAVFTGKLARAVRASSKSHGTKAAAVLFFFLLSF